MSQTRFGVCLLAALCLAFAPRLAVASQWGSGYGDPPGFCPAQSWLPATYTTVVTNDPKVGSNPEQNTFWGTHANPGYDDWYGSWYGDFRGRPGDASGWRLIRRVDFPSHWHWNFADWGWAVHGHVKQYIAYYNWTFGGQCGMGWYGSPWPAPYMADVVGYPVIDIYVDSVPPVDPQPRIVAVTPGSISFSWDQVVDRGDGAGPDYFAAGMDHYTSWLTVGNGPPLQRAQTSAPIVLAAKATIDDTVCAYVVATDRLGNATVPHSICGRPAGVPPLPPPPPPGTIRVNPTPTGLAGLATWFWLDPAPVAVTTYETADGVDYRLVAQPMTANWNFGDGVRLAGGGFGTPYPEPSTVQHVYTTESEAGYPVTASVSYQLSWWWRSGAAWLGPYPLGSQVATVAGTVYPVRQAQPELLTVA
jgi:hypothetical protein